MMMHHRILIADDHRLFRDGLKSILVRERDIDIVGEASDGVETLNKALELKPDYVLLDVSMPKLNGIEAARRIMESIPRTRIIMVTMHDDLRYIVESLRVGVAGYILKESATDELLQAIRSARCGSMPYLSRSIREIVMQDYLQRLNESPESAFTVLSGREREVLQGLAEGLNVKEIASRLDISVKTIESHRKNIMDKLNMHTIAELTKYAVKEGLTNL